MPGSLFGRRGESIVCASSIRRPVESIYPICLLTETYRRDLSWPDFTLSLVFLIERGDVKVSIERTAQYGFLPSLLHIIIEGVARLLTYGDCNRNAKIGLRLSFKDKPLVSNSSLTYC